MTYNEYLDKALVEIKLRHGNGTTEMYENIKLNLHTVASNLIMLDLMETMKTNVIEKEETPAKATKKTASK